MEKAQLIKRADKARKRLKKLGHTHIVPIYTFMYLKGSDDKEKSRVQNVIQGRVADKEITERLEDIADQAK